MKATPVLCAKCGKRLIDRLPNGLFYFRFGKGDEEGKNAPVDMLIHGSIKMVCLRKSCRYVNTLTLLPVAMEDKQSHCANAQSGQPEREKLLP